jgi:hypothetical protein
VLEGPASTFGRAAIEEDDKVTKLAVGPDDKLALVYEIHLHGITHFFSLNRTPWALGPSSTRLGPRREDFSKGEGYGTAEWVEIGRLVVDRGKARRIPNLRPAVKQIVDVQAHAHPPHPVGRLGAAESDRRG